MPQPAPPPHRHAPAGAAGAAPSWAGEGAEADAPAQAPPPATAQMPLFDADGAPAAGTLHARLRGRIRTLLARRRGERSAPDTTPTRGSTWADSFFDVEPKP